MNTTWADGLIATYKNVTPKYRQGRIDAAKVHAADDRLTPEQRSEWQRIATTLEAE